MKVNRNSHYGRKGIFELFMNRSRRREWVWGRKEWSVGEEGVECGGGRWCSAAPGMAHCTLLLAVTESLMNLKQIRF